MSVKQQNIDLVIDALAREGITNPYSITGILSVIQKESGFVPQSEKSYSGTSNERIRQIFSRTRELKDSELTDLKKSPERFFNFVYGGRFGNAPNEGYRYRGRGFNQLTFKDNYSTYSKLLGLDLVRNPDMVNDPKTAARVVASFMKRAFENSPTTVMARYGAAHINDFYDLPTAVNAFYNANAGFGKDTSSSVTSGKTQALSAAPSIFTSVKNFFQSPPGAAAGLVFLSALGYLLYKS